MGVAIWAKLPYKEGQDDEVTKRILITDGYALDVRPTTKQDFIGFEFVVLNENQKEVFVSDPYSTVDDAEQAFQRMIRG